MNEFRWLRSKSGNIWSYWNPEFGTRGTVVKEGEGDYHAWGTTDTWGVYKTLREAKEKVEANVGKGEE